MEEAGYVPQTGLVQEVDEESEMSYGHNPRFMFLTINDLRM